MKLWERYIFTRLGKTFIFLLACLFGIYVIVDLSAHGVRFLSKSDFADIALYYFHTFATLLELFLTLAFLLATMRIVFDLVASREIIALLMAGISKKRILAPFFIFATILTFTCYVNSQWFAPEAQDITDAFKTTHKTKKKKKETVHIYSVLLDDDTELVYQSFEKEKKELFDVFWVKSSTDIWHMKYLKIDPVHGRFVNHLVRNKANQFEKVESFVAKDFPDLLWNDDIVAHRFVPFENRSLTTLLSQSLAASAERASIFTHLYYKLVSPLMPFLVLFALAPISMRFSRNQPLFIIATASIFGLIALKVIFDGMLILGENQVLPAFAAIFGPLLLALGCSVPSFVRMR
ncbi:MAG: hypothetical protein COT85_01320 [Chlamydiae bacterium CG10_big_fil_rev_8_21_14_0_10_42_34]|nr:MAG: hypothetical protein COT85_01320 [Chlamydiae bacterium CG10_big_fil_rev_8_21_14_0_10_42_34]